MVSYRSTATKLTNNRSFKKELSQVSGEQVDNVVEVDVGSQLAVDGKDREV